VDRLHSLPYQGEAISPQGEGVVDKLHSPGRQWGSHYQHQRPKQGREEGPCGVNCKGGRVKKEDLLDEGEDGGPNGWVNRVFFPLDKPFNESEKQYDSVVNISLTFKRLVLGNE
jgi:hypothetical protein